MKYIGFVIYSIIMFILGYYCESMDINKIFRQKTMTDTNIIERWESSSKKDTVITFLEKIKIKEIKPELVKVQKIDSSDLDKIKKINVILDICKSGDSLKIISINQNQKYAKEFSFLSGLGDFRIISGANDIFYSEDRNLFEFRGIKVGYGYIYDFNRRQSIHQMEGEIDITLFKKIDIRFFSNSRFETGIKIMYSL